MVKLYKQFEYEYKNKYIIISNIHKITNICKNGCKIYLDDKYINIEAFNNNSILYAYELIKKEIINNKIIDLEKKDDKNNIFNLLNTYNIIDNILN